MSNVFINTDSVAREALMLLQNNLVAVRLFDRQYEAEFTGDEAKGDTIRIKRFDEGSVQEFTSTITQDQIDETKIDLQLEKHYDASFNVTSKQLTLNIDQFSAQLLAPRMIKIAEQVDSYALTKLKQVPTVGGISAAAPAALPSSTANIASLIQTMDEQKIPLTERLEIISPEYKAALLSIDSFVEADKRGDAGTTIREASLGHVMGMDHFMGQGVDSTTFTSGTQTAAVVNGAVAAGATSIVYDGGAVAAGTIKDGDIVTIAGYGNVVCNALSTASTGAGTFTFYEPLRVAVANDVVLTVYDGGGNTRQLHGVAFNRRAFAFASVPLNIPEGAVGTSVTDGGLSVRVVRQYDITTKKNIWSLDVLVGAQMVEGRLATQIVKNI